MEGLFKIPEAPAVFVATHKDRKGNQYMLSQGIYWDDYGAPAGHITSPRVAVFPIGFTLKSIVLTEEEVQS